MLYVLLVRMCFVPILFNAFCSIPHIEFSMVYAQMCIMYYILWYYVSVYVYMCVSTVLF